jgi:hypothetical protein
MRLKHSEVKPYRLEQLEKQNSCCSLCGEQIVDDAVLDHDHKTGLVRMVLHRGCNALLGKIENNMVRNKMSMDRLNKWASNIVDYINKTHTDVLHPTYKTVEERKAAQKLRRKKRK